MNNYSAYGDVNPIEHGGQWIRKTESNDYDIITLKYDEVFEELFFGEVTLDIRDSWIDLKAVNSYCGASTSNEQFALDVVSYYGILNCGGSLESVTVEEAIERLASMNIFMQESLKDIPYLCGVCEERMSIKEFNSNEDIVMKCSCGHTETTNIDEFKNSEYWRY